MFSSLPATVLLAPALASANRYSAAHTHPKGPGDARPTAQQIVRDHGLVGKLQGKVRRGAPQRSTAPARCQGALATRLSSAPCLFRVTACFVCLPQTVLITGCTSGLGVETARALHSTGATVFITARDGAKADRVVKNIAESNKATNTEPVQVVHMELDSLASVRDAAADILKRSNGRINILITNAGK